MMNPCILVNTGVFVVRNNSSNRSNKAFCLGKKGAQNDIQKRRRQRPVQQNTKEQQNEGGSKWHSWFVKYAGAMIS